MARQDHSTLKGIAIACVLLTGLAACTVQPVYSPNTNLSGAQSQTAGTLSVAAPSDRDHQLVRNRLTFLLDGGAREPAIARFDGEVSVTIKTTGAFLANPVGGEELRTTRQEILATASLSISENGDVVQTFRARSSSAYDTASQEFARLRAEKDARQRVAEDVAQKLYIQYAAWIGQGN